MFQIFDNYEQVPIQYTQVPIVYSTLYAISKLFILYILIVTELNLDNQRDHIQII